MLYTTFTICRKHGACEEGYKKLAKALGGVTKYGRNTPIPIEKIIETNSVEDAAWALRATPDDQTETRDRAARLFACDCAESVLPIFEAKYPDDKRPRQAIEVARRFAIGEATVEELAAAWDAARDAAWAAAGAAARAAAGAAAWDAARDAARDAAWAAAGAAAGAAVRAAARAAAWDAAWAAAGAAARAAAGAAARAAAWAAAWAAEREKQTQFLIIRLNEAKMSQGGPSL